MTTPQPYYPSLADLVDVSSIPGDFEALESLAQEGVNLLLQKIRYKDLIVKTSSNGGRTFYSLDILTKSLRLPIFNTGLTLVFFNGSSTNFSEFPILLDINWPIKKYISDFSNQGFSYTPEAFIDIFMELANIPGKLELLKEAALVFLDSGDVSLSDFFDNLNSIVSDYNDNTSGVDGEIQNITTQISNIKTEALTLSENSNMYGINDLLDNYQENSIIESAIQSIEGSIQILDDDYDIELDFQIDIIKALLLNTSDLKKKFNNLILLFKKWISDITEEELKALLLPQFRIELKAINMALEFPRTLLMPMKSTLQGSELIWSIDESTIGNPPEKIKASINYTAGGIIYDTQSGLEINIDENNQIDLPRCMIPNIGMQLEFHVVKLDLSRTKNIPEATTDGRPEDFIGVYVQDATIIFPANWNHDDNNSTGIIKGRNLLIGTGGISGSLSLEAKQGVSSTPLIKANFGGGFSVSLDAFSITFKQNSIVDSTIKGTMKIPGFKDSTGADAEIAIEVFIDGNGDFRVTASEAQGISINIPNVLSFKIFSVSVGKKDDKFYAALTGEINFTADVPGLGDVLPKNIQIKKLVVWEDGSIQFEAGGITLLPKPISLNIGPVKLKVSNLQLGSHEQMHNGVLRQYLFFGFDGEVDVKPGGVNVKGSGVKFYFTKSGSPFHCFLRIQRIDIDLIIPGSATPESAAVLLKGYVSMTNPANSGNPQQEPVEEYAGGVDFTLPKMKMGGSAAMRLRPKTGSFVVDASLELSTPILLGTTGLGIYGFRGLIGLDYVAAKSGANLPDSAPWWQYYKAPPKEGIVVDKMDVNKKGFSLGAGVSLATTADGGRAFSSKLFFLLSLPEVFLLQGQAAVMAQRLGLDTTEDPPFFALISISKKSIEAAFGVKYSLPKKGEGDFKILDIEGIIEMAYFFGNSSGWYVNIGRDQPENMRVRAEIFSIFQGYSYLMISSAGLRMGAGITWEFKKNYGPAGLELGAYLHTQGKISFKPVQIGGSLLLGGYARIKVFKFKFGFDVKAMLAAELPRPFIISGEFTLSIDLPKPFKDIEIHASLTWRKNEDHNPVEIPLIGETSAAGVNVLTKQTYAVNYFASDTSSLVPDSSWKVLPLDTFVDLEFSKPILPNQNDTGVGKLGGIIDTPFHSDTVPPQKGISEQFYHEFVLNSFDIKYYDGSNWIPYDIYAACLKADELSDPNIQGLLPSLKNGYWQLADGKNKYNKLRVLSQTPFSFTRQGSETPHIESLGLWSNSILCPPVPKEHLCQTWEFYDLGTPFTSNSEYDAGKLNFTPSQDAKVANPINIFDIPQALTIAPESSVLLSIPDNSKSFKLRLETLAQNVTVIHYSYVGPSGSGQSSKFPGYKLVKREILQPEDLFPQLSYESETNPVSMVLIKGGPYRTDNEHEGGYYGAGPAGLGAYGAGLAADIAQLEGELQQLQDDYDDQIINDPSQAPSTAYQIKEKQKELDRKNDELTKKNNFSNESNSKSNDTNNDPSKKFKDKTGKTKVIVNKIVKTSRYVYEEIVKGHQLRLKKYYQLPEKLSNGRRYIDMIQQNPSLMNPSKELRYHKGKKGMEATYGKVRDYLRSQGELGYYSEPSGLFDQLSKMLDVLGLACNKRDKLSASLKQDLLELHPLAWYIQEAARFDLGLSVLDVEPFPDMLTEALSRYVARALYRFRMIHSDSSMLTSYENGLISGAASSLNGVMSAAESDLIAAGLLNPYTPGTDLEKLIRAAEVFHLACSDNLVLSQGSIDLMSDNYEAIADLDTLSEEVSIRWTYGLSLAEIANLKFAQHYRKYLCRKIFEGENPISPDVLPQLNGFKMELQPAYTAIRQTLQEMMVPLPPPAVEPVTPCTSLEEMLLVIELGFVHLRNYPDIQRPALYGVLSTLGNMHTQLGNLASSNGYNCDEDELFPLLASQFMGKLACTHSNYSISYQPDVNMHFSNMIGYYNDIFNSLNSWGLPQPIFSGGFCDDYNKYLNVLELAHIYQHRLSTGQRANRMSVVARYWFIYELVNLEANYPFSISTRNLIKKIRMCRFFLGNLKRRGFVFRTHLLNRLTDEYNDMFTHYNNLKNKLVLLGAMPSFPDQSFITDQLPNFFDVVDNACAHLGEMGSPDYIETINVENKIDGMYKKLRQAFDNGAGLSSLGDGPSKPLVSALKRVRVGLNRYNDFATDIQSMLDNDAPTVIEHVLETTKEIYSVTTISDDPEENIKEPASSRGTDDKSKAGEASDHTDKIKDPENASSVPQDLEDDLNNELNDVDELSERIKEELEDWEDETNEEAVVYHEIVAEEVLNDKLSELENQYNDIKLEIIDVYNNRSNLSPTEQSEVESLKDELDRFSNSLNKFQSSADAAKDYELLPEIDFAQSEQNHAALSKILDIEMAATTGLLASIVIPVEPGSTMLYSACFTTPEIEAYNASLMGFEDIEDETRTMAEALNHVVQPIWRPNTYFAIEMETIDKTNGSDTFVRNHTFGFRTKGPVGHYHVNLQEYDDLLAVDKQDQFQLKDIQQYLDYEKSYPDPGSQLLNAKPMYYEDLKFSLLFKEQYMYHMYNDWAQYGNLPELESKLELVVKGALPDETVESPEEPEWIKVPAPIVFISSPEIGILNAVINSTPPENNCIELNTSFSLPYFKVQVQKSLKPDTLYNAIWKSRFGETNNPTSIVKEEIWHYGFQTSMYASLSEQLSSHILSSEPENERKAIYAIPVAWDNTTRTETVKLLNGQTLTDATLLDKFPLAFDRLMNGLLKLAQLPAPVTTDINIYKDGSTIRGLQLRSPEPFFDPRTPEAELQTSLTCSLVVGGTPDNTPIRQIFSKDCSQIFLANDNMDMTAGILTITFKYKLFNFDTNSYLVEQQSSLVIDLSSI
jgi:hypothetical protein